MFAHKEAQSALSGTILRDTFGTTLQQSLGDSFAVDGKQRKESGFSAALFLTPPKLNLHYPQLDTSKTQIAEPHLREESSFARDKLA